jgi:hypothetical protein
MTYVAKIRLDSEHTYFISLIPHIVGVLDLDQMSHMDKMIFKEILSPNGLTPNSLSKKFKVHAITIARRRKRLEEEVFEKERIFSLDNLGWRCVDFFIVTTKGKTDQVANDLLELDQVTFVGKSIGQHSIDLQIETIVKDNAQILDLLEEKGYGWD